MTGPVAAPHGPWWRVRFRAHGKGLDTWQGEDILATCAEALAALGCRGVLDLSAASVGSSSEAALEASGVAWVPRDRAGEVDVRRCLGAVAELRVEVLAVDAAADTDWVATYESSLVPFDVGERLTILPGDRPAEPGRLGIRIRPGRAFGTGQHETTRLALSLLERELHSGDAVLDVGTGSGILAFAAARLGAARVEAIDDDPEAVDSARENLAALPERSVVTLRVEDDLRAVAAPFDLVVANITADALEALLPRMISVLRPGGRLVLSGIQRESCHAFGAVLERFGLVATWLHDGEWSAAVARDARQPA